MAARVLNKVFIGAAIIFIGFLLVAMVHMAGGIGNFLHPVSLLFAVWAISPVAFLAWRLNGSLLWLLAFLPIVTFGSYLVYEMAYYSRSSTSALGWIFYPFYA